jgi:hypothetical protein
MVWAWVVGIVVVVAAAAGLWWPPTRRAAEVMAFQPAASQQAAQEKPKLTIKDDQKLTLAFGRAREQRVRTVAFTVEGSLPAGTTTLSTTHSAFSREGDDAQIPASDVKTRARKVGARTSAPSRSTTRRSPPPASA